MWNAARVRCRPFRFIVAFSLVGCAAKSAETAPEEPLGPVDPNVRPHPHAAPPHPDVSRDMVSARGFQAFTCDELCYSLGSECSDQGCPVRDQNGGPDLAVTVLYVADPHQGQTRRREEGVKQYMASTCAQPLNLDRVGAAADALCCCPGLSRNPVRE
jgi:hypothetical protein